MREEIKYGPPRDGLADCPYCKGRGVVSILPSGEGYYLIEATAPCKCVVLRDKLQNMERGWRGLSREERIPKSPLIGRTAENLWITSKNFRQHLHSAMLKESPGFYFKVASDADLMAAWLAPIEEVYDADVSAERQRSKTTEFGGLLDLVDPPELLIIITGVKAARNSAAPEVLLEALTHRGFQQKPTWVVDTPDQKLTSGHISYDDRVGNFLSSFTHLNCDIEKKKTAAKALMSLGGVL